MKVHELIEILGELDSDYDIYVIHSGDDYFAVLSSDEIKEHDDKNTVCLG